MINEKQKLENKDPHESLKAELLELRKSARYKSLEALNKEGIIDKESFNKVQTNSTYGFIPYGTTSNNVTITNVEAPISLDGEEGTPKINAYGEQDLVWVNPLPEPTVNSKSIEEAAIEHIKEIGKNSYFGAKTMVAGIDPLEKPKRKNSITSIMEEEADARYLKSLEKAQAAIRERLNTIAERKEEKEEEREEDVKETKDISLKLYSKFLNSDHVAMKHAQLYSFFSHPRYRGLRIIVDRYNSVSVDSMLNVFRKNNTAASLPDWFNILTEVLIQYRERIDRLINEGLLDLTAEVKFLTDRRNELTSSGSVLLKSKSSSSSEKGIFDKYYKSTEKTVKKTEEAVPIEESEEIIVNYIELADFLSERDLRIKYKDYSLEKYEQEYNDLNAEYVKQIIKFKRNKNG